jgi:K+-sensing histidine kinase KdpD
VLHQLNRDQSEALQETADAKDAKDIAHPSLKSGQSELSFPSTRDRDKPDLLDRLARNIVQIRPFSATALAIAISAVGTATLLRYFGEGYLRFGIYIAAILVTGLLAGPPAAFGAATASMLIVIWAFVPPHFAWAWPSIEDQIGLLLAAVAALITICFAHCCRLVLRRLHQREVTNGILVNELCTAQEIYLGRR